MRKHPRAALHLPKQVRTDAGIVQQARLSGRCRQNCGEMVVERFHTQQTFFAPGSLFSCRQIPCFRGCWRLDFRKLLPNTHSNVMHLSFVTSPAAVALCVARGSTLAPCTSMLPFAIILVCLCALFFTTCLACALSSSVSVRIIKFKNGRLRRRKSAQDWSPGCDAVK